MTLPMLHRVLQTAPQPTITDVAGEVRRQWLASRLVRRVKPGDRVAIGCGSRGIRHIDVIAKATVEVFLELGAKPFIVAAMGSHGGATADGQRELLAEYNITEQFLGVPIKTDMETVQIGVNSWGDPVWWDRNATEADGVVTLSRIKPHTDYRAPLESGIAKMCVIGLGKRDGANQHHRWGSKGLSQMLPESAKVIIEKTNLLGGLGILENANEETAHLQVLDRDEIMTVEPVLLNRAKEMIGKLPFDEIDVLIIGELGKNYSGAGLDTNVVGRFLIEGSPEMETNRPKVTRMVVLDVSPESHGNATGVGIADLTTNRLLKAIDPIPFRMNNLTACCLRRSQLPFAFETDAETIAMALQTCWQPIPEKLKLVIIPNTLEVTEMWVSPVLAGLARQQAGLQISEEGIPVPFDAGGSLEQEKLFPHSVRGRRRKGH